MTLTHLSLIRGPGADDEVGAAVLRDILWAHVRPGDPVEHISVRAGPGPRLEIGVFTAAAGNRSPTTVAHELVDRALRNSPALDRWKLAGIRPGFSSINSSTIHGEGSEE